LKKFQPGEAPDSQTLELDYTTSIRAIQEVWLKFYRGTYLTGADNFINYRDDIIISLMKIKFVSLIFLLVAGCTAGNRADVLSPAVARQTINAAWHTEQHTVWQLDWPGAPLPGTITAETWRSASGRRLEILEAPAPGLWGQTLVFDGQTAWVFNRFEAAPPTHLPQPRLSPFTDVFNLIESMLTKPAQRATTERTTILQYGPTQKITLIFDNDDQLAFWLLPDLDLPVRVTLTGQTDQFTLTATHAEPMTNPPANLFKPPTR